MPNRRPTQRPKTCGEQETWSMAYPLPVVSDSTDIETRVQMDLQKGMADVFSREKRSEVKVCGSTIGIHGGGEGKRTWTGMSFQVADVAAGASLSASLRRKTGSRPISHVRGHRGQ